MKILSTIPYALAFCAALAVLSGCGAPATPSVSWMPMMGRNATLIVHPDHGPSWMAPEAKTRDLLYISDVGTNDVYVYSYSQGKLVGTLKGFSRPSGLCVDAAGDVFVTELNAFKVREYAHGGTRPLATLSDPGEDPGDCSIDPTTGNLAVSNVSTPSSDPGDVVIYKNARGIATIYRDPEISYDEFCGYDNQGNLYVDGMKSGAFQFAELPSGKTTFTNITLNESFSYGGAAQWDGKYMAVGDYESKVIYQFSISGEYGTAVGSTHLQDSSFAIGFWIQGSTVVGPNDDSANVMFWKYPAGGSHTKTIGGLRYPWGSTVSLAK
jgi:hypothetical protein